MKMPKVMQNIVILLQPPTEKWDVSLKGGNMILNRFCIDEDAAFELSGVHYLEKWSGTYSENKGKGYSSQLFTI